MKFPLRVSGSTFLYIHRGNPVVKTGLNCSLNRAYGLSFLFLYLEIGFEFLFGVSVYVPDVTDNLSVLKQNDV